MDQIRDAKAVIADARVMWCRECGTWTVSDGEPSFVCAACGAPIVRVRCARCGGEWQPRTNRTAPRLCYVCKSGYWCKPYRDGTVKMKDGETVPRMVAVKGAEHTLETMLDAPLQGVRAKGGVGS